MSADRNRILHLVMAGILLVSMYLVAGKGAMYVNGIQIENRENLQKSEGQPEETSQENKEEICVVIDAGHGGADPGKVGINDALEKDINLEVARYLKIFLESEGIKVVMTREDENGLYDEGASNKKVQDMKRRLQIIEDANPVLVVSIHQNSYHEEYVKGAQVFYYTTGKKSRALAEMLQTQLKSLDEENSRQAKGNDSYYLLKKTKKPIVIVECGFLSNIKEAEKLVTPIYQEKLAFQLHMGIVKYLNALY